MVSGLGFGEIRILEVFSRSQCDVFTRDPRGSAGTDLITTAQIGRFFCVALRIACHLR